MLNKASKFEFSLFNNVSLAHQFGDLNHVTAQLQRAHFRCCPFCDQNSRFSMRFKWKIYPRKKTFPPTKEFSYFKCPRIEEVNTIINDVENEKSGHPQVIIIHCGTNDLTTAIPGKDFISNISASISQACIKFQRPLGEL